MSVKFEVMRQIHNQLNDYKLKNKDKLDEENQPVYRIEVIDKSEETGRYQYKMEKRYRTVVDYVEVPKLEFLYREKTLEEVIDLILEYLNYCFKARYDLNDEISRVVLEHTIKLYGIILSDL